MSDLKRGYLYGSTGKSAMPFIDQAKVHKLYKKEKLKKEKKDKEKKEKKDKG